MVKNKYFAGYILRASIVIIFLMSVSGGQSGVFAVDPAAMPAENSIVQSGIEMDSAPDAIRSMAAAGSSPYPPAVVSWGANRLDIFLVGNNNQLYHKAEDGSAWYPSVPGWESLGGNFNRPQQPAVVSWGANRLDVFLIGNNNQLYHKAWNGSTWSPSISGWESLGGSFIRSQQPTVVSWGENRLDIFLIGNNNRLYHKAWNGTGWSPSISGWESLGGNFTRLQQPTVVSWGENRLDVFLIGNNNKLYHKAWNGTGWSPSISGWESLRGNFTRLQQPAVVSWGANRLDIFLIGNNNKLYHKAWNGTGWYPSVSGWESLGGSFTRPPAVVSWGVNRLDVFLIGNNKMFYHKAWNGTSWSPSVSGWESLGGSFTRPPAVVSWGVNRLDVFLIGNNKMLYHKAWNGTSWSPSVSGWESLGGSFTRPPAVVSWGANRLDVFLIGNNKMLYHKAWDGTGWYPSVSGWQSLGGKFNKY